MGKNRKNPDYHRDRRIISREGFKFATIEESRWIDKSTSPSNRDASKRTSEARKWRCPGAPSNPASTGEKTKTSEEKGIELSGTP